MTLTFFVCVFGGRTVGRARVVLATLGTNVRGSPGSVDGPINQSIRKRKSEY